VFVTVAAPRPCYKSALLSPGSHAMACDRLEHYMAADEK
jgi:hypothetical protein